MKCIIFDCDGVLVDSEIITTKYFIKHLHDIGYQISIEDAIKRFTGISDKMVYEAISKETGIVFTAEQIDYIQDQVHHSLHAEIQAITGISELLASLEKNGNKTCVASSGTLDKINKSLGNTNLIQYFHDKNIFSVQHVSKGKPAPDLFLYAAEQMSYEPKDCIVIEDSLAGIEAAIAANMRVIGFLGGSHTHYEWYKLKMSAYNIPIAHNSVELFQILMEMIEVKD
jgi:HAD superfamily hydrolase (TIGR01509 family)